MSTELLLRVLSLIAPASWSVHPPQYCYGGRAVTKSAPYTDLQSQRDCVFQPRVARNEPPWVRWIERSQPQRGCGSIPYPSQHIRRNAVGVGLEFPCAPKVGADAPTLGFEPQSRWD
jgi:hypothetical protein